MLRKLLLVLVPVLATGGIVIGLSGTAEAVTTLTGPPTGSVTCSNFIGGGKVDPKLTATGISTPAAGVKINFKGVASTCSGPSDSVTIGGTTYTVVGAKVTASGYFVPPNSTTVTNKCSNFEGAAPTDLVGAITMTVKWKMSPALAVTPSVVKYTTGPYTDPTAATSMNLEVGATPLTPYSITGSYAASVVQDTVMDIPTVLTNCPVGKPFVFGPPSSSLAF